MTTRLAKWLSSWRPREQDEFSELTPEERIAVQQLRDAVEELNRLVRRLSKVDPAILRAWRDHLIEQEKSQK